MRFSKRGIRSRMLALTLGASVIGTGVGVLGSAAPAGAAPGDQVDRMSTKTGGGETGKDPSECLKILIIEIYCQTYDAANPTVSPNGRYVAFDSQEWDLTPGIPQPVVTFILPDKPSRVYLKDRQTNETTWISARDNGEIPTGNSTSPTVSNDAKVAFLSTGAEMSVAPSGSNGRRVVYLRDGGRTIPVSDPNAEQGVFELSLSLPGQPPTGGSFNAQITPDGNRVIYQSNDKQVLAVGQPVCGGLFQPACATNTYIWTRTGGATGYPWGSTISLGPIGNPHVSADGHWLVADSGGKIVRHDLTTTGADPAGTVAAILASAVVVVDNAGLNGPIANTSISNDGTRVAFTGRATNIVAGDSNQSQDVFVKNTTSGQIRRLSVSSSGSEFTKDSLGGALSGDGNWITFTSLAPLVSGGSGQSNGYLVNTDTGAVTLLTRNLEGAPGGGSAYAINNDGSIVTLVSGGVLAPEKTNKNTEIYAYDSNGVPTPAGAGPLWLAAADGGVFAYGGAQFYGSMGGTALNQPVTGIGKAPDNAGYWLTAADGGIFAFGSSQFFGSMGGTPINQPVVGLSATPTGNGYWEVAKDGGIFAFGDAEFAGSMGGSPLNQPIVGIAATATGKGYYEIASDGGIFAFGDAEFFGSTGAITLNQPIIGMAVTKTGNGYYLVASDGGIFAFGDAEFLGSEGGSADVTAAGMALNSNGNGYRIINADGSITLFTRQKAVAGKKSIDLNKPIVGVAAA